MIMHRFSFMMFAISGTAIRRGLIFGCTVILIRKTKRYLHVFVSPSRHDPRKNMPDSARVQVGETEL